MLKKFRREKALKSLFPNLSRDVLKTLAGADYLSIRTLLFLILFLKDNKKNKRIKELNKHLGTLNDIDNVIIVDGVTISSYVFRVLIEAEKLAEQAGRKKVIREDVVVALKYYLESIEDCFLITEFFPAEAVEREVAVHEAGHAIVATCYPGDPDIPWVSAGVGIIPEPEIYCVGANCFYDFVTSETQTIKNLFKHCVVSVAGYEAVCFVYPEYENDPQGCDADFDDITRISDELIAKCCQNGLAFQFNDIKKDKNSEETSEKNPEEHENNVNRNIMKYGEESKKAEGNETNEDQPQAKVSKALIYYDANELPKEIREKFREEIFNRARHEARVIIQKNYLEFFEIVETLLKKKVILRRELIAIHKRHENDLL